MAELPAAVRAVRPRQWVKNGLVLAAPLAAGRAGELSVLGATALAFVAFSLAASSVYLLNDVRDVEEDRRHPTKRFRAIAAGDLSPTAALVLAGVLVVLSLALALYVAIPLAATIVVYLAVQLAYAMGLKHQPVMDLAAVASGFLLRAIAGGVASDIPLSPWFLLVASFGSLFMVAGKRYSEIHTLGADAGTRRSLEYYSESYLRFVWSMAVSVTVVAYSLWAFRANAAYSRIPWDEISVAPFTLAMLRYAVDIDRGTAGAPEDIAFNDRVLQALALAWVVTIALAVYS
jgi:decaprenyl-phosphate phosphoribosyltransferase